MITDKFFTYTEEEWSAIEVELRRTLDLDATRSSLTGTASRSCWMS
jgi:hypothetical protein